MNWINNVVRPKIRSFLRKKDLPDNLWVKCPDTGQMIYYKDLEANQFVVPGSNFHMRMTGPARLRAFFDDEKYAPLHLPDVRHDPLKFRDERRYSDRLKDARAKTGLTDAVHSGIGKLHGDTVIAAVQDFDFMGGSLGTAAGEAIIASMRAALVRNAPFILFAASGGARMQEGILSLMQMPRTTVAVEELREAGLPYIVVLTNPTTGGVTASYAMLGDIHIAEPGALVGFAGPRVIEQTIREQLPAGFQRSEYLLEHGMVDMVVHRHELRGTLARLCNLLLHRRLHDGAHDAAQEDIGDEARDETGDEVSASAEAETPLENGAMVDENARQAPAEPEQAAPAHAGNGLAAEPAENTESDEALTNPPSNGANQRPSHNA